MADRSQSRAGGSGLFAPGERSDGSRAGVCDGMEQYVGVGQAKAWLQQNEEALPSQRASKSLDSSRLQRSSRSPKRPGHSLVVPVALPPDLPESEGVVKPHRSTAVKLLEGLEGIETSDSLIELPDAKAAQHRREPEQTSPSCQRRVSANVKTRSVPELDSVEPVRVVQTSPLLGRRTLHSTMWGSPRETRIAPPRLYWPTMTGRSTIDLTSKQPVRLLSPAITRRNIEPMSGDRAREISPVKFRVSAESWNPPWRRAEDFSWQPGKAETRESSLENAERLVEEQPDVRVATTRTSSVVPEAASPLIQSPAMSLVAPAHGFQSRATLGATESRKISFQPVNRATLTPQRSQAMTPPVRSHFPAGVSARSSSKTTVLKTPAVVVRYVRQPILLHAVPVPAQLRSLPTPLGPRVVHGVK